MELAEDGFVKDIILFPEPVGYLDFHEESILFVSVGEDKHLLVNLHYIGSVLEVTNIRYCPDYSGSNVETLYLIFAALEYVVAVLSDKYEADMKDYISQHYFIRLDEQFNNILEDLPPELQRIVEFNNLRTFLHLQQCYIHLQAYLVSNS